MDIADNDIAYLTRRLAAAERQAGRADNDVARLAHLELARLYRARLATIAGTTGHADSLAADNEGHQHE